jgi:preprotein translocase subunit SecG
MRAQGTIEYLVILAVIVVISLVVVTLMVNSTAPAASISEAQSELYWKSQPKEFMTH